MDSTIVAIFCGFVLHGLSVVPAETEKEAAL